MKKKFIFFIFKWRRQKHAAVTETLYFSSSYARQRLFSYLLMVELYLNVSVICTVLTIDYISDCPSVSVKSDLITHLHSIHFSSVLHSFLFLHICLWSYDNSV